MAMFPSSSSSVFLFIVAISSPSWFFIVMLPSSPNRFISSCLFIFVCLYFTSASFCSVSLIYFVLVSFCSTAFTISDRFMFSFVVVLYCFSSPVYSFPLYIWFSSVSIWFVMIPSFWFVSIISVWFSSSLLSYYSIC